MQTESYQHRYLPQSNAFNGSYLEEKYVLSADIPVSANATPELIQYFQWLVLERSMPLSLVFPWAQMPLSVAYRGRGDPVF